MKYESGDFEAQHASPVWKSKADCIIAVYLGNDGGKARWEQLWGSTTGDNRVFLCCIPFFAYDINLGDELEINSNFVVTGVSSRSSQFTFRAFSRSTRKEVIEEVTSYCDEHGFLYELYSENLLAISAPSSEAANLSSYLLELEETGAIEYETGMTK